jgi:hypothetical protein
MPRPPFNAEAKTKEDLEASRSPEFLGLEMRALKGGATLRGAAMTGVKPLTLDEAKLVQEYLKLHKEVGNSHVDGWEESRFG